MKLKLLVIACLAITLSSSAQSIHRTACQGDLQRLDSMLAQASIQIEDDRGRSLLHWAVACRKKEVIHYLLEKGIEINAEDHQKKTAMHVAAQFGNIEYFELLLELQSNQNWMDQYGASLLEQTVLQRDTSFLKTLLKSGVDINSTNARGSTALEMAQRMDANEFSKFLMANGADKKLVRKIRAKGKYMGQKPTGKQGELFAPNFISTEEQEFGSVFNASGDEFFFGVDVNGKNEIRYTKRDGRKWSKPQTILSHDRYGYNDPFLSPDENRLYFISNRALDGKGEKKDIDIWYVKRTKEGWSAPINAGPNINSERNEYYISFTKEGRMYYSSNKYTPEERIRTDYDILFSEFKDGAFQTSVALGDAINTNAYEADVFVDPDEKYLIFCSTRTGGFGRGDLYISFKKSNGQWTPAKNMGAAINSHHYEYCPFVSMDGKYLFYTSNQDIYWISTEVFEKLKE